MSAVTPSPSFFRTLNRFMIGMFRLGLGPYLSNPWTGYIMVLTTQGRKTGLPRRTPVNYAQIDGDLYCTAGFGHTSDWYRNLVANPEVQVWLKGHAWVGRAETVTDESRRLPLLRRVWINSGFVALLFEGINPKTISDEALAQRAAQVPVVRIHLEQRLTGPGGPGDLVWLWPIGLALMALLVALRPRRR